MSVAFQTNTNRIQPSGFPQEMWIYNSSDAARFSGDDHHFPIVNQQDSTSSSSSIGNNSDASGGGADSDDDDGVAEVQSVFKGPLNTFSALEDALPIKRGISTFYAGKSKSYTSLADAVSAPSIQDIVKPEDAYNRKRKNMIAHSVLFRSNLTSKNGLSKRLANSNRGQDGINGGGESSSLSSSPSCSRPPLPAGPRRMPTTNEQSPRINSTWRSLSLSDLQHAAGGGDSTLRRNKRVEDEDEDEDD